jgi:hypothetical protein
MLNRKLLEVLRLLNPSDHARLRLFLQSPYFNHRSNAAELLRLYDYICVGLNEDEGATQRSKAAAALEFFPKTPFLEGKKGPLDALASDLFGLVKRFMAQTAYEEKDLEFEESLALAKFYRRYGMEERYWQVIQTLRKLQQGIQHRDAIFFQNQYLLEEEAASFESLNNSFEDDANLAIAAQNLDIAYLLNKMEITCALSYQQQLSQSVQLEISAPLTQAALMFPENYPGVPLYELNRLVFQQLQQPENTALFDTFEQLLESYKTLIPFHKLRNLKAYYRFLQLQRYLKSGNVQNRHQMFEVYREHYEQGYFYEEGAIMINSLRMLVQFGLKVSQYDWVKKTLEEHPPTRICGTNFPVEAHSLCMAEYFFYTKDYEKALETLMYKHFSNPSYGILGDLLLIKIYFETSDELLDYRMKALEQKVRRTKISKDLKGNYYRFLQKLGKIIKYSSEKNSHKLTRLLEEIKTTPGVVEREWLLEKLATP